MAGGRRDNPQAKDTPVDDDSGSSGLYEDPAANPEVGNKNPGQEAQKSSGQGDPIGDSGTLGDGEGGPVPPSEEEIAANNERLSEFKKAKANLHGVLQRTVSTEIQIRESLGMMVELYGLIRLEYLSNKDRTNVNEQYKKACSKALQKAQDMNPNIQSLECALNLEAYPINSGNEGTPTGGTRT